MYNGRCILLIVSGSISAYKTLDLIRRLRDQVVDIRCVLTESGTHFVTPIALAAVSGTPVYQDLFSLKDETEMGHIRLSREVDAVVVAPATADLLAKMAHGLADDLASTTLLATHKPVLVAPAMNVQMWRHPATQANMAVLERRGVRRIGPVYGTLACGEEGEGRMAEIPDILTAIESLLAMSPECSLTGRQALVTSGPTYEAIDPVRYIANRSSGRQGHAIAAALARRGAQVTLVSGPTDLPDPVGVRAIHVESAHEMLTACEDVLPVDVAVCAAAVADWRVISISQQKLKKVAQALPPVLSLAFNPDILATLSRSDTRRPYLVVGFAAETEALLDNACRKRTVKECDWIVANDVSARTGVFGSENNTVYLITAAGITCWPTMTKVEIAESLAERIVIALTERGLRN
ncbi:Phosphopantothenoylcysteine decarboxylase / Phosphopantothenoylcysteine synthetase [invertebrate metagenome]|uniref:Phosphopantothenoylcysteine decarboxylase / Phosphopantothenoylcysteine synthetase n=1 Tax=invertebrate metagenome TaxID=1711999 RepID=A0A484HDD3_9ZZZZ